MLSPAPPRRAQAVTGVFASLLESRTGQQLDANREWRIETALKPVLRERGLETLDQLAGELLAARDKVVGNQIIDALLNQETSFFRDAAVLDMVAEAVTKLQTPDLNRRVRIWSAGCSSGQEPLSLAMLFAEREESGGPPAPEIVATDVSEAALARGRAGRYSQFEIQRGLPIRRMMRWFETVGEDWVASSELVRRIQFRQLNLVDDPLPIGRFDVILCRNVLLYFSPAMRRHVFARLAEVMRPGGLLVLGAGETVIGQTDAFRPSPTYRGLYEPTGQISRGVAAA
jgi:chemotaxis protein methyltransferase CheR